ncbi:LacI family DNA-binding transcriptional regulator [Actinoalloteichus hymeniacidonis]|uniref:Transcriptional regulator n=1 Tax=Actinoalloteichus hymeniacidonis TaxID=340345 RepID=A0AAC9HST6_9PSEU|nr:LacI family DNA-binding transcriptional regulator [Actinoalloteichus hymeniacidonis]AOS64481.1 transcriptional regulator [Actinoalloteichus hymeniacidonis]MBB5907449.1 DNA-binding LacI/PurR family transcriptional regulator [Actinoalloteichus hymeniacidonis]
MPDTSKNRRATAADVARAVGVSRTTVGFVLNDTPGQTISAKTRQRVRAEAARLGYRPSRAARALAGGRSGIILFVLPDWPVDFALRRYLEEAAQVLADAGYSLVTHTRRAADRARPLWELLDPEVVCGIRPFASDELASMQDCGITRILPEPGNPESDAAFALIGTAPESQVRHLHGLGHRRLAFAGSAEPRLAELVALRASMAATSAGELGIAELDRRTVDHRDDSARLAVTSWREAGVTGVVAYNDEIAAVVAGAAVRAGIRIPEELAVIGSDDTPLASMFVPSLSSVRLDGAAAGRWVARLALWHAGAADSAPPTPDLDLVVVPRESTGHDHR